MPHTKPVHESFVSYWDSFYSAPHVSEPSPFARFVRESCLQPGDSLLEIGCGNGRDAGFFGRTGLVVTAMDLSTRAIDACIAGIPEAAFVVGDFTQISLPGEFDFVYSRFTLHAVDEEAETLTMASAWNHLRPGGRFCIEARTVYDELCGRGERISDTEWIYDGHYRRFLEPEQILKNAREAGFFPAYIHMAKGLAPWGKLDPVVLRLVLQKPA